jgi:carbon-monoxide dehydrogenase small subunit
MDAPLVTLRAGPREKLRLALTVNGEQRDVLVDPYKTLLELLREDLGLTGTKHGCELGECGACAVLLDGDLVLSCLVTAVECGGRAVTTVEGLRTGPELHPLQTAFADHGAAQCGYCTPGMLVAAAWLLGRKPDATREEIAEALSGQLCRCTGYLQIFEAVESAGRVLRGLPPLPPRLPIVNPDRAQEAT